MKSNKQNLVAALARHEIILLSSISYQTEIAPIKDMCQCSRYRYVQSNEGSGESVHLHRLA